MSIRSGLSGSSAPSERTRVRRNALRAQYNQQTILEVLQSHSLCTVAYVVAGEAAPRIIPQLYFVQDNFLYLHGNRQSALLNHLLDGGEVAISVLLVDGIVVARSGFHCSMNYRSVSLFGAGELVEGAEKAAALDLFVEALIPGHNEHARPPTSAESAATSVVRIPLGEMSAKIRAGDPGDPTEDLARDTWAGTIPAGYLMGEPVPSKDLKESIPVPDYIKSVEFGG